MFNIPRYQRSGRHCMLRLTVATVSSLVALVVGATAQEPAIPGHLLESIGRMATGITSGSVAYVAYCVDPDRVLGAFVSPDDALGAIRGQGESCGTIAVAVNTTLETAHVPVTSQLKRVAEAADGFRTGDTVWVVVSDSMPHRVKGVFFSELDAMGALEAGFRYMSVLTQRDSLAGPLGRYLAHRPDSEECEPGDEDCGFFRLIDPGVVGEWDSASVQLLSGDTVTFEHSFGRDEVDAIFFTLSAIDKFILPYLMRLHGVDYAARFRRSLLPR